MTRIKATSPLIKEPITPFKTELQINYLKHLAEGLETAQQQHAGNIARHDALNEYFADPGHMDELKGDLSVTEVDPEDLLWKQLLNNSALCIGCDLTCKNGDYHIVQPCTAQNLIGKIDERTADVLQALGLEIKVGTTELAVVPGKKYISSIAIPVTSVEALHKKLGAMQQNAPDWFEHFIDERKKANTPIWEELLDESLQKVTRLRADIKAAYKGAVGTPAR